MTACCSRRKEDGVVDPVVVDRAVAGLPASISPSEFEIAVWRLSSERRWGLGRIAAHLGYSRSQVAATMQKQRLGARP